VWHNFNFNEYIYAWQQHQYSTRAPLCIERKFFAYIHRRCHREQFK
jgi:hypothetical protein